MEHVDTLLVSVDSCLLAVACKYLFPVIAVEAHSLITVKVFALSQDDFKDFENIPIKQRSSNGLNFSSRDVF